MGEVEVVVGEVEVEVAAEEVEEEVEEEEEEADNQQQHHQQPLTLLMYSGLKNCPNVWLFCKD